MKAKTILQLMTLGTNIYLISRDKELMDRLSELLSEGKEKIENYFSGEHDEADTEHMLHKLLRKTKAAEKEFEHKVEAFIERAYEKINIAHTHQVEKLQAQIDDLKKELDKRPASEPTGA